MITKKTLCTIIVICVMSFQAVVYGGNIQKELYPLKEKRSNSPGDTTYFIDPVNGDDNKSGTKKEQAWRGFRKVNLLFLAPGDRIEILAPGELRESLMLMGKGSPEKPIVIHFAPGRYDFFPELAVTRKYHISNANDYPSDPKSIFLFFFNSTNFRVEGDDAWVFFRGMTIEACIDHSENIAFSGIHFDYHRPTVSEFTVLTAANNQVEIQIHPDSQYIIEQNVLTWVGEGWKYGWLHTKVMAQELNPKLGTVRRCKKGDPLKTATAEEIEPFKVRVKFENNNPGMKPGIVYQLRKPSRDYVGIFINLSKNVSFTNVGLHFLHGMGVIGQFSENLTFDSVTIAPRTNSGRTCAAWADCLHFSGCRGKIRVINTVFSGANDDAINVHGTHLRITAPDGNNKVKVSFMHKQTYGFDPFYKGDEIDFIKSRTMLPYASNKVTKVDRIDTKAYVLTLEEPLPSNWASGDVIENATWTPEVEIRGCHVSLIPTRGFLLTTRRKVVVEQNEFVRTFMSAILISDDANRWYESGFVRDVTIRNNRFVKCGVPVIRIHPENRGKKGPVHKNIKIINNDFFLEKYKAVAAKSTENLSIVSNRIYHSQPLTIKKVISTNFCTNVYIEKNEIKVGED